MVEYHGIQTVNIEGKEVKLQDMVKEYQEKHPERTVVEAKMRIEVHGDITRDVLKEYLDKYMDWEIANLDVASWIYLPDNSITVRDKIFRVKQELGSSFKYGIEEMLRGKPLKDAWGILNSILTKYRHTIFDHVQLISLVSPDASEHIIFGCKRDCQPTLQEASNEKRYQEFLDYFSNIKDVKVQCSLCAKIQKPKTQYISGYDKKIEGETETTGWTCLT